MPQTRRSNEEDEPNPELDHEKKEDTLEERLLLFQASYHDQVRDKFTALSQKFVQNGYNACGIDLPLKETMEQLCKLQQQLHSLKNDIESTRGMRTGTDPSNKVIGHEK
ncbi:hypothetical protein DFH28DRAFT_1123417 [Melampsora americana]|nr:hypothetical protein DFH28DRAFT_933561 [Melampsora americana]KAH9818292.1 hypothetical protein DFH28DRAFT_1123417 [Melampsora americana]